MTSERGKCYTENKVMGQRVVRESLFETVTLETKPE